MNENETVASNPFGGVPGGEAIDAMWVIMATFIIFTMQSGFGLLESGKEKKNILILSEFLNWKLDTRFSFLAIRVLMI